MVVKVRPFNEFPFANFAFEFKRGHCRRLPFATQPVLLGRFLSHKRFVALTNPTVVAEADMEGFAVIDRTSPEVEGSVPANCTFESAI